MAGKPAPDWAARRSSSWSWSCLSPRRLRWLCLCRNAWDLPVLASDPMKWTWRWRSSQSPARRTSRSRHQAISCRAGVWKSLPRPAVAWRNCSWIGVMLSKSGRSWRASMTRKSGHNWTRRAPAGRPQWLVWKRRSAGSRPQEIERAQAALEEAEANLNTSRINLERAQRLMERGVLAKQVLDDARNAYDVAAAQVKVAGKNLELAKLGPAGRTDSAVPSSSRRGRGEHRLVADSAGEHGHPRAGCRHRARAADREGRDGDHRLRQRPWGKVGSRQHRGPQGSRGGARHQRVRHPARPRGTGMLGGARIVPG